MSSHRYAGEFFEYINAGSLASARVVCPLIVNWLQPRSVLDVGCGAGAWCRVWMENAVPSVIGVDGAYVERSSLLIDEAQFRSFDLAQPFDLGDTFDLVVSLEVAEHLAAQHAAGFVDNLVRHGRKVLFSAATPGQGGEFHVNEQPLQYWREHFAARGFQCFDPLRSRLSTENRVEPWYRYNSLLYVREDAVSELPEVVQATRIPEGTPIPDVAPVSWRARNAVLRTLPRPLVEALAKLKHEWVRQKRRKELADAP